MAYCFKRTESVPKAVRRVGGERLTHALTCLSRRDNPEAIHCARKDIKRVRALVRLVRSSLTNRDVRQVTRPLQEAASLLGSSRDAYIKAATLREVSRHPKGGRAPRALGPIRAALRKALEDEMRRYERDEIARAVGAKLRRARRAFADLEVSGKGWKALRQGVKASYRKSRRAYRTALKRPSAGNFHAWRKRAKDLWYQVKLLRPACPGQLDPIAGKLKALGDHLGDDHDLFMLREELEGRFSANGNAEPGFVALSESIEQKQDELRKAALAIGARLHAEKPSVFCARLDQYWHTWQA